MKRYSFTALILSLFTGLVFTACNSDDDENLVLSRDCIVRNIVLGTLQQPRTVKDSKGNDSTYVIDIAGINYPMSIDQIHGRIYNPDSLPKGTDLTKVIFSTLQVTGYATVKSLVTGQDTVITDKDTLDFSMPRKVTVHASDRTFSREYTLEVRVHKESPDSIKWHNLTPSASSALTGFADCRVMADGKKLYVFGQTNDGSSKVIATQTGAPSFETASDLKTAEGKALDIRSIRRLGQTYYALSENKIFMTADVAQAWTSAASEMAHFDALTVCSNDSIYALEGGKMYSSADGCHWVESMADTADKWPTSNLTSTFISTTEKPNESLMLLSGNRDAEIVLWQQYMKKDSYFSYPWMFMPQTEELGHFPFPHIDLPCMVTYDEKPLLLGLTTDKHTVISYQSSDNGRTWKPLALKFPLKEEMKHITFAVDDESFIWSVSCSTGQVFKGRHNRMGWLIKD